MASTDKGQHFRQGADALLGSESTEAMPGCQAGDLKSLLAAIVDQISEADRRHTDTLAQVQDRLAGIGREAKAIKPRVPDSFAAAFERIEAGMSELASRISEAGDAPQSVSAPVSPPPTVPVYVAPAQSSPMAPAAHVDKPTFIDPPAALRSASDHMMAATRRREEEASRAQAGVDTFDVIETSLPGNVSDPWDRDAAEALTGLYESVGSGYVSKVSSQPSIAAETHALAPPVAHVATAMAMPGVDLLWLESRFAELSKHINESIADVRPDQGFFAIGQRVDRLEQHFSGLLENVATHNDVEGVRLIEAHVSELANHMENAHQQLMRLDAIEDQLAGIAAKLDDVHHAASIASNDLAPMPAHSEVDMHAVARTAAEAAAKHFSSIKPSPENNDTRDMLRSFIAEARQGEENTTALLDTLQQAMIRLLDRIDTMELNTLQTVQAQGHAHAHSAPQEYVREQVRFAVDPGRNPNLTSNLHETESVGALDAAVAAVASAKSMSSPFSQAPGSPEMSEPISPRFSEPIEAPAPRSPEKLRQDFIADARRAKMRLNSEGEIQASDVVVERPEAFPDTAASDSKSTARTPRGAVKTTTVAADTPAPTSMITPRLRVMALAGALALTGGWYATQVMHGQDAAVIVAADPATASAPTPTADASATSVPAKDASAAPAAKSDSVAPADAAKPGDAPAPKVGGSTQLNMRDGTRGEIVNDQLTVGSTSVPLVGVAVDTEKSMTPAEVQHAKQQQSIAAVSTRLGEAALQNPAALAFPAAISPGDAAAAVNGNSDGPVTKSAMGLSSALDMPPATVGPLSLRLAAANGDSSAQFEVGARLAEGKGTNQNFKDAAKWYQRSASQGFAQAQYRLGTLYERGLGLKADPVRATEWYKKAAEQGNVKAMHNLAVLSANQPGGTPDYATAAQWFEQAAEHGLSDSQFNLAVLHENGLGVEQNLEVAYKWLSLAAKSGDKEAIRRRDILQGKLTGEQLKKAEGLVGTWKAQSADQKINDPRKAGEAWKSNPANGVSG